MMMMMMLMGPPPPSPRLNGWAGHPSPSPDPKHQGRQVALVRPAEPGNLLSLAWDGMRPMPGKHLDSSPLPRRWSAWET
jgi:hypothetical protein